ncbi:O-antigen translocase [Microvirga sp. 0TCS3.31]
MKQNSKFGQSQAEVLKSIAMMGGASVVNIGFGMIRSKAIAVLLGPGGVGLFSLYNSIAEITRALTGLGIPSSGVRQIAEAAGSGDINRIAKTATVLRRMSLLFALAGAIILAGLAGSVSEFTFGSGSQSAGVALLAIAVFFLSVSAGQVAFIQGMRRVADLARMNMLSALTSTVVSVIFIYAFREEGIVPSLVAIALASAASSWWYSRKLQARSVAMNISDTLSEAAKLLKLGIALAANSILTLGAAYTIRIILIRSHGVEIAGLYQAAFTLGGLYTGFILQAMSTDFYPRLTSVSQDDAECNRLVNEQAHISMLLAGPGIVATLTFASLAMTVFYSAEFQVGVGLIRWICLGMMLRVIAWPMGYIVLAKGAQWIILWIEVLAAFVHIGLAYFFVVNFGFEGAGAAFFALYISHSLVVYLVVRRLSGFRWYSDNVWLGVQFILSGGLTFCGFLFLSFWPATAIGLAILLFNCFYSLWTLIRLCSTEMLPPALKRWLAFFARDTEDR